MEMLEGGTRADVASVLSEKLLEEIGLVRARKDLFGGRATGRDDSP
jgi:hypothetical protein